LDQLTDLRGGLETSSDSAHCRQKAKTIEAFFSDTARDHHAEEERDVFPNLLLSDDTQLVQAVLTLKQDHGWIEQNWLELAPMLRAIAAGEDWVDMAELAHSVEVFLSLCRDHIALEEALIYPEAKSRFSQEMAGRAARLA
jgi:hemerythrin-like domain-containing protein